MLLVSGLTLFAFAVNGYHPYADDGGLYMAGIKRLLDPQLFPHETSFVLEPMRFSLFAPAIAGIVRLVPLDHETVLPFVLLGVHLATLWATLFAAWMLAARCWMGRASRAGAVTLLACWLGLPVAGTALMLMDPYLTARSISTPCMVLALVGALDVTERVDSGGGRRWRGFALWGGSLLLAAAVHPLMAAYAFGASMLLACVRSSQARLRAVGVLALCAAALILACTLQQAAPAESAEYHRIALTRTYWFLAEWRWYEVFGLVAPLLILAWYARTPRTGDIRQSGKIRRTEAVPDAAAALARMAVAAGSTAVWAAVLFARSGAAKHLVARMQPLRIFQTVYLVIVLTLGAKLGEFLMRRHVWRWGGAGLFLAVPILAAPVLAAPILAAARATYPHSPHLETPWVRQENDWVSAFEWIRRNTPKDALFALDADYINAPGEDAQCFRAIAERSALADYSKDGGEASIAPALTANWVRDQAAQAGLGASGATDRQRLDALKPLGVSWVVLGPAANTDLDCPYRNGTVRVCRLGWPRNQ
jgi:hypothetical protein